jgi:hypothetical protein
MVRLVTESGLERFGTRSLGPIATDVWAREFG